MTLYELGEQYQDLAKLAADTTDEADAQAFRDTMEGLTGEIKEKIISCALVTKSLDAEATAINEEIKRLSSRKSALANSSERVKSYMFENMKLAGLGKIKAELVTVAIQKTPPSVVLDKEPEELPKKFQRVTVAADKIAIGEVLRSGETLEFAHLEQRETLRIR